MPIRSREQPASGVGVEELSAIVKSLSAARLSDAERIEQLEAQLLDRDRQQDEQAAAIQKLSDELADMQVSYSARSASFENIERKHKRLIRERDGLITALEQIQQHGTPLMADLAALIRLHDARMTPLLNVPPGMSSGGQLFKIATCRPPLDAR